jgi:hypothetical protein
MEERHPSAVLRAGPSVPRQNRKSMVERPWKGRSSTEFPKPRSATLDIPSCLAQTPRQGPVLSERSESKEWGNLDLSSYE